MTKDRVRQIAVIIATVATLAVNGLASYLPLNGVTTADVSDAFDVLFVPAGWDFSIWGIICIGLIACTIYQALPRKADDPDMQKIGWLYVLSCAANIAWLFAWHWSMFGLSVLFMLALLVALIAIYLLKGIGLKNVSKGKLWCVHIPFGVYLGWITVATVANVQDWFWSLDFTGGDLSPVIWAVIMLVVGAAITALVLRTHRDIAYALVIVWAFVGIAVKLVGTPLVSVTAALSAVVVAITLVLFYTRVRTQQVAGPSQGQSRKAPSGLRRRVTVAGLAALPTRPLAPAKGPQRRRPDQRLGQPSYRHPAVDHRAGGRQRFCHDGELWHRGGHQLGTDHALYQRRTGNHVDHRRQPDVLGRVLGVGREGRAAGMRPAYY